MRTTIQSVIGASIGGMAPTSLAVGVALVSETKQVADYGSSFFVGLLIFGILGGVVGYLWKEPDGKKAFNLGIALPALLQVSISSGTQELIKPGLGESDLGFLPRIVRTVHAESRLSYKKMRSLRIFEGRENRVKEFTVLFSSQDNSHFEKGVFDADIKIPDWAVVSG